MVHVGFAALTALTLHDTAALRCFSADPECTMCGKGTWVNEEYATSCNRCKPGFFNDYEGKWR